MLKKLIILALIGGLGYLNYTNPKEADHRAFLMAELEKTGPVPTEYQDAIWGKVDYTSFFICSTTKTTIGSVMISTGYLKKLKLVNDKWTTEARKELDRLMAY